MFQRCSAVSVGANAGIAVPVTPTDIFRNIIAGATSPIAVRAADRRRLRVERRAGRSVAHSARTVTGRAVRRVQTVRPSARSSGFRRQLERGLASQRRGEARDSAQRAPRAAFSP